MLESRVDAHLGEWTSTASGKISSWQRMGKERIG